jgi:type I restriction enzyme S subunit
MIPPGYKQTEVGMIPEEWEVKPLGELASVSSGGTPSRSNSQYWDGNIPWVTTSEVDFYTITQAEQFITPEGLKNSAAKLLSPGTLLIALYGQGKTRGKIGILGIEAATNQACAAISLGRGVFPEFIFHFLASQYESIRKLSNIGNQENLSGTLVRSIRILCPPLPEQRAIATALSDVDALLAALDRLIAKQRDLKQAAMQQLLTGQTRLPGFTGKWETKRLGEICEIAMGRTPPRLNQAFWGHGYKWLSIADLQTKVVSNSKEEITELAASTMTIIPKGTLLMSFKLSLGRLCFAGCDLFTNEAICSFNNLQANAEFLYYVLGRTDFSLYGKQAVKGYTLNKESLKIIEVTLPPLPEQTAIAAVLTDMDATLSALEQRRDKTRALKQGMMQELLTGRTRLV